jgi:hypothetical protein
VRELILSLAAIAALALLGGGVWLALRRGERRRGGLMIAAGLVLLFNVWSWGTLPTRPEAGAMPGSAPAEAREARPEDGP